MPDRQALTDSIIAIELEMFLTVPTAQKASCQDYPESFRLHRRAQFSVWSSDTLNSYLADLEQAKEAGINLMTIKYAYMDDLIPRGKVNPLIEKMVSLQYQWQQEMISKYPHLMGGARPLTQSEDSVYQTSFETYLWGELETYSDNTISLLFRDLMTKQEKGLNMSEEVYQVLVTEMGYASLKAADLAQKKEEVKQGT